MKLDLKCSRHHYPRWRVELSVAKRSPFHIKVLQLKSKAWLQGTSKLSNYIWQQVVSISTGNLTRIMHKLRANWVQVLYQGQVHFLESKQMATQLRLKVKRAFTIWLAKGQVSHYVFNIPVQPMYSILLNSRSGNLWILHTF